MFFFFHERQMQGTASLCCKVCPQHLQSPCILWGVSEQTVKIKFPWAQAIWGWTVSPLRAWKLRLAEESEFDSNGSIPRAGGRSACSALTVTGFKWFPSPVFQGKPAGCEEQTATRSPTPRALSSNKTSKVCHKKKNTHTPVWDTTMSLLWICQNRARKLAWQITWLNYSTVSQEVCRYHGHCMAIAGQFTPCLLNGLVGKVCLLVK